MPDTPCWSSLSLMRLISWITFIVKQGEAAHATPGASAQLDGVLWGRCAPTSGLKKTRCEKANRTMEHQPDSPAGFREANETHDPRSSSAPPHPTMGTPHRWHEGQEDSHDVGKQAWSGSRGPGGGPAASPAKARQAHRRYRALFHQAAKEARFASSGAFSFEAMLHLCIYRRSMTMPSFDLNLSAGGNARINVQRRLQHIARCSFSFDTT